MGIRLPRNVWRGLWRDQSGATALITGLALLLIACVGMTVFDLGHVQSQKSKLQDMLDAAALAAAKVGGEDEDAIKAAGDAHLKAHLPAGVYKNLVVEFTPNDKTVVATATAAIDPYFLNMFMDGPVDIAADSEVTRSVDGSLEVVLALDTTGSMAGSKLETLKKAADGLVKKITKVKDADVKVGVVPFSNYVNVGAKNKNASWISGAQDRVKKTKADCRKIYYENVCTKRETRTCTGYNDGTPYEYQCKPCVQWEKKTYNPPLEQCWDESVSTTKWKGCVGSPAYPANVQDKSSTVYPAQFPTNGCATELTPLTDKLGPIESAIKSLKAEHETYIPAGLAWGWNLLSPGAPFTEAAAYDPDNKKPRKVLVLMTDGANTLQPNPNGSHGTSRPAPKANEYTSELCENIKKAGVELYVVGFQIDDAAAHEMLLKCASSSGHYFKADSSEDLINAFEAIGRSLENLRISH